MAHKILAQYMDYYTKNFGDYIDVGDLTDELRCYKNKSVMLQIMNNGIS